MPLSEFIREARRLAELCNYPIDQDRLIRDMIVSRIQSLRAYQKCIDSKDCTDCSSSPQDTKWIKKSSNSNRHRNKTTCSCYYCGAQNWTREHSKVCKAKNHTCGRCGKKGHLDSLCRSAGTPLHMLEAQAYTTPQPIQSQKTLHDYNQSLETAQYSTPYFVSREELPQMTDNSLKTTSP